VGDVWVKNILDVVVDFNADLVDVTERVFVLVFLTVVLEHGLVVSMQEHAVLMTPWYLPLRLERRLDWGSPP
jgi:hypothetical protein